MRLSIITAVLNGAHTIRECIESVLNQTCPVQHILVDGGSTDGTRDIIGEYGSAIGKVVSGPDAGIYDAMNKGIALAEGDVIGFLNADDRYAAENVIERVAGAFETEGVACCYGDLDYVDGQDPTKIVRRWRSGPYQRNRFFQGWMPPHPTFFCLRACYERFGGFRLDMGSAADYELMLRFLLKHGISAAYIPGVLVRMRSGGVSNASVRNRLLANAKDRMAWKVNGMTPRPWTLHLKPLRKLHQFIPLLPGERRLRPF